MRKIVGRLYQSLANYSVNTGDFLPMNVLAKSAEVLGGIGVWRALNESISPKIGVVAAACLVGGAIVDKATGGLNNPPLLSSYAVEPQTIDTTPPLRLEEE